MLFDQVEINKFIILLSVGIVLLVSIFILLYVIIFKPLKYKKMVSKVDSSYQFCHALLVGQNSQNVKRLEIISRTNLLYVETYTSFSRRLKEIRDNNDVISSRNVGVMKEKLEEKNYKEFKVAHFDALKSVNEYKTVINNFTNELNSVLKPEEDCRQASLELKTQYRNLKQDYYSKENQLAVMNTSFNEIFKYIDSLFQEFENLVESAQYDDANNILPKVKEILDEINYNLTILPNLCALISTILPEKVHQVNIAYEAMVEEHYPLKNLFVKQNLETMLNDLNCFSDKVSRFDTDGISEKLSEMQSKLEKYLTQFDEEKEAKKLFDDKSGALYSLVNKLENRFIRLSNIIPEVSEIYILDNVHLSTINDLKNKINKMDALKRTLDTYIHSSTKQPYSLVVEKMYELDSFNKEVEQKLDEFDSYVDSLRYDAETAHDLVFETFAKVKKAEDLLKTMSLKSINDKYKSKIDSIYTMINQIYVLVTNQPIKINEVNDLVHRLSEESNTILDDGEILQDYNMMLLAESAIMYGNNHRNHIAEIDQLLSQAETFFEKGDFEKANTIAKMAINKIQQTNGK